MRSQKQIRWKMLSVLFMSSFFVGGAHAEPIVAIQPANQSVVMGAALSVDIMISGVADLYAFQFDLGFDPSRLSATQFNAGPFLSTGGATFIVPPLIDNSSGQISGVAESLLSAFSGVSGGGVLATVQFKAIGPGASVVNTFNGVFLDSSLSGIGVTAQGGSIFVSAVPEPATVLLTASTLLGLLGLVRRCGRRCGGDSLCRL